MKNLAFLFFTAICPVVLNAQAFSLCKLQETNVQRERSAVYIKTDCLPQKEQKKWDAYYFLVETPLFAENAKKETTKILVLNEKFYTGFVVTIQSVSDSLMLVYQYNRGLLEQTDTLKNTLFKLEKLPHLLPSELIILPEPKIENPEIIKILNERDRPLKKPVLYLYPPEKTTVSVQVMLHNQEMIHPYPAYKNGWNVTAMPDGTLLNNETGRQHYCLFWETQGKPIIDKFSSGFVVEGSKTAAFLEEKLPLLGLSPKEMNEFIIFWLPQMENNRYNMIYFAQSEYKNNAELHILPTPDALIRVMMLWQSSTEFVDLPEQVLPKTPIRKGFVAVEWGGQALRTDRAE